MILLSHIQSEEISKAIKSLRRILKDGRFQEKVRAIDRFDMSAHSGADILKTILEYDLKIVVRPYRPARWMFWKRKVRAYTTGRDIFLNVTWPEKDVSKLVETLMHEVVHVVDDYGLFGHGSNYNQDKKTRTAPIYLAALAKEFHRD